MTNTTRGQILILILINIVLLTAVAVAADSLIIKSRGLRFDFYPHYVGGREVWRGHTPYTREVTERIQLGMFGELLPPEADQQNMAYPAYSSIVLAPVIALPAKTALAVWMAIQFVSVLWTPVIWMQILNWRPAPWLAATLILGLLFVFRYPMDLFVLGQFSGTVLLCLSLGFLLLLRNQGAAAGIVLALATIPPTMGLPLALAMLIAFGLRGRWHGFIAFIATLAALILVSVLLIGNWLPDYLHILREYQQYAVVTWAVNLLRWLPLQIIFVLGLLAMSLAMLWRFIINGRDTARRVPTSHNSAIDLVITALIVSLLLIPQTGEYNLVLLIPPLLVCVQRSRYLNTPRQVIVRLSVALAMISPWLYARGADQELPTLLLPLHVLVTWLVVIAPQFKSKIAKNAL